MRLTTLCYIDDGENYLMLHRTKKEMDQSKDKWLGVGGKFEDGESPDECMLREVYEETGLTLKSYVFNGIVTFVSDIWDTEYMFIYTATKYSGYVKKCDEGDLQWIPKKSILDLPIWEGDKIFLEKLLLNEPFFNMKFEYRGYELVNYTIY